MHEIIENAETRNGISSTRIDTIQKIIGSYYIFEFFPWVCLILLYNRKNWKRPVILVLILHYLFRATGNFLRYTLELREPELNTYWPYSTANWYISVALANVFYLTGEIIGDWYPLLRTKAVTKNTSNNKHIKLIYITCIAYNLVKVYGMYCYFMDYPIDIRIRDENNNPVEDIITFKIRWWSTVAVLQIASFIYDLSIILALKKSLFDKLQDYQKKGTFLDKFKQISELRIFISMITSILFLPFVIVFVITLIDEYKLKRANYIPADNGIEQFRQVVLGVNFTFMYIDQILLRFYAEKSKIKSNNSSKFKLSHSFTNTYISTQNSEDKFTITTISTPSIYDTYVNEASTSKRPGNGYMYNDSYNNLSSLENQIPIINKNISTMKTLDDYNIQIYPNKSNFKKY
ncbi:hypothetical protein PIROE2DRAFT_13504 [Piromyces sp. E2]|nr:hypothetical protein PIROE2DRAFT_13504 [Piromyces sp. E2]|eukprot:OUM60685.1 hypothetical protein PIROE2DRAFT_13504 [Piromyces sp. E2]